MSLLADLGKLVIQVPIIRTIKIENYCCDKRLLQSLFHLSIECFIFGFQAVNRVHLLVVV